MTTVIKAPPVRALLPPRISVSTTNNIALKFSKPFCLSLRQRTISTELSRTSSIWFPTKPSLPFLNFVSFASEGETETTETEQLIQDSEIENSSGSAGGVEEGAGVVEEGADVVEDGASIEDVADAEEAASSVIVASLELYKEALASNDVAKAAEIEAFLKSIEDEKIDLERKVLTMSDELSVEKDRILRISADFDNFRKRTERERLSLVTNAQGEVVEKLLSVLDNFERAKAQIKVQTEGEEKISNSYQSIYKQFMEILSSLGVLPVETIGKPFDPLLHEAIMREDSEEFEEGIILQEFRKGFKLGDRLLRPSMVKVSAGPGPVRLEQAESSGEGETASETTASEGDLSEESDSASVTNEEDKAEAESA